MRNLCKTSHDCLICVAYLFFLIRFIFNGQFNWLQTHLQMCRKYLYLCRSCYLNLISLNICTENLCIWVQKILCLRSVKCKGKMQDNFSDTFSHSYWFRTINFCASTNNSGTFCVRSRHRPFVVADTANCESNNKVERQTVNTKIIALDFIRARQDSLFCWYFTLLL